MGSVSLYSFKKLSKKLRCEVLENNIYIENFIKNFYMKKKKKNI